MTDLYKNPCLKNRILPVDIVLHPSWWFHNEGITFDEDFFFHPKKRVEVEQKMEKILYDRWGEFGLGSDRENQLPVIGAIHLAAGYLISGMLGCKVEYYEDKAPQVRTAYIDKIEIDPQKPFQNVSFKKLENLMENLKNKYGYLKGDVNWSGVLNVALDLRGDQIFLDMFDRPDSVKKFLYNISLVIENFINRIKTETGTSSISVNRNIIHFPESVYLHSECSCTMISTADYEKYIMPVDIEWSKLYRPFGIHFCGNNPHRFAESFSKVPYLDFLDVGWGGDIKLIRKQLPNTFLNIRISPVELPKMSVEEIQNIITKLVRESVNP